MYFQKEITEDVNKILYDLGYRDLRWIVNYDPSKVFVVNTIWISSNKLSSTFGRVYVKDLKWLMMHEILHYHVAPQYLKNEDNFGMPRDDVFTNKKTGLNHEDCILFEDLVQSNINLVLKYLSDYEKDKLINFKF